jgi:hypothetical protein
MWGKTTDISTTIPPNAIYKCKVLDVKYNNSAITAKQQLTHANSSNDQNADQTSGALRNNPFVQLTLEVSAVYLYWYVLSREAVRVIAACTNAAYYGC